MKPLPALLLTPFFARSLTLVPRSLLLKCTETLATQANFLTAAIKFHVILQTKLVFFVFLSLALALSLLSTPM